jgi:hypothetical protein
MTSPEQTLQFLAGLDPDYLAFVDDCSLESVLSNTPYSDSLVEDVLSLLRDERPDLSVWLDTQPGFPMTTPQIEQTFAVDPITTAGVLAAIVFLLRTHIKYERTKNGKWSFRIEHKPAEDGLLKRVLDSLDSLLNGKGKQ